MSDESSTEETSLWDQATQVVGQTYDAAAQAVGQTYHEATQVVEQTYNQVVTAVEQTYNQVATTVQRAYDSVFENGGAANDHSAPPTEGKYEGWAEHITAHVGEHELMHMLKLKGVMGPISTLLTAVEVYCTLFAPCSEEERAELDRQYTEWYRECYPEIVARGKSGITLYTAGCEADHGGTSWSGPYRILREDAIADLNAHIAAWPDHEIVTGEGDVEPTDDGAYVAGCEADHGGTSWSGPERWDLNEAIVDLEQHLAEWPDHRLNSDPSQPGAKVRRL